MPRAIRNLLYVPLLVAGAAAAPTLFGCGCAPEGQSQSVVTADHRASLRIDGMTCASCSVTVRVAATALDGVASVDVDVDAGTATVLFDSTQVTAEQVARAISGAGYATTVVSDEAVAS